jgi:hypothetical protein
MYHINIRNSAIFPHIVYTCFVRFSEQTEIISLNGITRLVFVMETQCIYVR